MGLLDAMDVAREVYAFIRAHQLLEPGDRVVVAVSGGMDSVALLHLLRSLSEPFRLQLHVAHLHHGLRGPAADADADAVRRLACEWELPCTVERVDLRPVVAREKLSLEEAARRARYAFLCRVAIDAAAATVAVAHHADDQSETVLMHLLRGAGPAGLRGMLPVTYLREYRLAPFMRREQVPPSLKLIRPLLELTRSDIERYCTDQGLETRFDCSNLDTTFFRNRLRLEVLPYLEQVSPRIGVRLRQLAKVIQADYAVLQELVDAARQQLLIVAYPDALVFDLRHWRAQPLAIRRALVRQSAYELCPSARDVDYVHIENAITVAQHGVTGAQATLPHGLSVTVGYTTLSIGAADVLRLPPERPWLSPPRELSLQIPDTVRIDQMWCLQVNEVVSPNLAAIASNPDPLIAYVNAQALGPNPVLRTRRTGDRFCPQGMAGAELRLSDFLNTAKVPRAWRDHLPLVEGKGRLLWVGGVRVSELALVHPTTTRIIQLAFRPCPAEAGPDGGS